MGETVMMAATGAAALGVMATTGAAAWGDGEDGHDGSRWHGEDGDDGRDRSRMHGGEGI